MATEPTNRQNYGNYSLDSLRIVFACLADSLPGSSAAVYLHEEEGGNLVLQKSDAAKESFVKSIPASAVSDLTVKTGSGDPQAAAV